MDGGLRDAAIRLFNDYRIWWLQTANIQRRREQHPIRMHKQTEERVALFEKVVKWCQERELDPRLWLYCLFRSRRWSFAPKLQEGHLMSENMVSRYERMVKKECLDGYRQYLYTPKPEDDFDPNRDISPAAEAMKARYAKYNQRVRCMLETLETTFGYHPKSPVCQACPMKVECSSRLEQLVGFNIQALREGKITAAEARAQVGN